jgi:hypothetical protein
MTSWLSTSLTTSKDACATVPPDSFGLLLYPNATAAEGCRPYEAGQAGASLFGGIPKWPKGAGCKPVA